jgi:dTDP-4-dehydrorhamnose 3,5-epimerase
MTRYGIYLPEVRLLEPRVFIDERGFFTEFWNARNSTDFPTCVQDNVSYSAHGVLRGLHIQHPHGQGKFVSVLRGEVFDVAVDVRRGSPMFGQWTGYFLSHENRRQLYIPPGFAHGFLVTGEEALFFYKCSEYYNATTELTIRWNDPALAITWPAQPLLLSSKDGAALCLNDIPAERLPEYQP